MEIYIFLLAGTVLFDEKFAKVVLKSPTLSGDPFRPPNTKCTVRPFLGGQFFKKEDGLHTYKPSFEKIGAFSCGFRTSSFFRKFEIKIQLFKHIAVDDQNCREIIVRGQSYFSRLQKY